MQSLELVEFYRLISPLWRGWFPVLGTLAEMGKTSAPCAGEPEGRTRYSLEGQMNLRDTVYQYLA